CSSDLQQEDGRDETGEGEDSEPSGEAAIDPEETAVDVTEFLPPEPEAPVPSEQSEASAEECAAEDAAARTVAESAAPDDRLTEAAPNGAAENGHAVEAVAERPAEEDEDGGDLSDAPKPIGLVEDVGVEEVESNGGENGNGNGEVEQLENIGAVDALEEVPSRPRRRLRSYKNQEVIKRRQIVLVQVVKEERGSKGGALTDYP